MTEEEARAQTAAIAGDALPILDLYAALLLAENTRQNLIARSTEATIWRRHLLDSAQLARFARDSDRTWIDIGSGPGLPGIVLAALGRWSVTLVEPRRRRAEFLRYAAERLALANLVILDVDIRLVAERHDVVSARAVAPADRIFELACGCADEHSRYILPKGRSACEDVDLARGRWQGLFHVEQSLTDHEARVVIADQVRPR